MPIVGGSRTYRKHTKLGKVMDQRGLKAFDVQVGAKINPRLLSDYLAGRKEPSARSKMLLVNFFRVSPDQLFEDSYPFTAEMAHEQDLREQAASLNPKVDA